MGRLAVAAIESRAKHQQFVQRPPWRVKVGPARRLRPGAVAGLLDQCEQALRSADAAGAAVPLEAAPRRAEESGVASQAARLARYQEDLALLRDLDAVDQVRWMPIQGNFLEPVNQTEERNGNNQIAVGVFGPER